MGDSLYDVAKRYKYEFIDGACGGGGSPRDVYHKEGSWYEPKYGEGAQCYFCHVIIPKSQKGTTCIPFVINISKLILLWKKMLSWIITAFLKNWFFKK